MVRVLENKHQDVGYYVLQWDEKNNVARNLPSGVYFLQFAVGAVGEVEHYKATRKLIIVQ